MRILLTGPTGFIGGNLLQRMLAAGHQVAALVLPAERLPTPARNHPALVTLTGSLAEVPWPTLRKFRPEACVHTAWITTPDLYWESPQNDRFLEWSQSLATRFFESGGTHFVGLGSCAEYAPSPAPLDEIRSPLSSATRYARAKNALRVELGPLAEKHGARIAWARVFYPYGPGELPARFGSALLAKIGRGEAVELRTPDSVKDYIYIDDVTEALHTILVRGYAGVINVGTGAGTTVREMALALATVVGRRALVKEAPVPGTDPLDHVVADTSRLRGLGWKPEISLVEGARRLARQVAPHLLPQPRSES